MPEPAVRSQEPMAVTAATGLPQFESTRALTSRVRLRIARSVSRRHARHVYRAEAAPTPASSAYCSAISSVSKRLFRLPGHSLQPAQRCPSGFSVAPATLIRNAFGLPLSHQDLLRPLKPWIRPHAIAWQRRAGSKRRSADAISITGSPCPPLLFPHLRHSPGVRGMSGPRPAELETFVTACAASPAC